MNLAIDPPDLDDDELLVDAGPVRLARTDIFRGGLVIATAVLIGVFVISSGLDRSGTDTGATGTDESPDPAAASADAEETEDTGSGDNAEDAGDADSAADDGSMADPGTESPADDGAANAPAPSTDIAGAEVGGEDPTDTTEPTVPPPVARPPAEVLVLVLNGSEIQGIAAQATAKVGENSYQTAIAQNADELGPSVILYADGYDLEAIAVAEVFGPNLTGLIQPLTVENQPVADLQGANVIVVVGGDGVIPVA